MNRPRAVFTFLVLLLALALPALAGSLQAPAPRPVSGGVSTGEGYHLAGAVGQAEAGTLSGGSLRLNGGLLGEMLPGAAGDVMAFHLPMLFSGAPFTVGETEPNDYFYQADPLAHLPVRVSGHFDGAAGTGDLFAFYLSAGATINLRLETENPNGVQLLAYDPDQEEITRDYAAPFEFSFAAVSSGTYYVYAFSPLDAANEGSYSMRLWRP